jgi:hypothetical protein
MMMMMLMYALYPKAEGPNYAPHSPCPRAGSAMDQSLPWEADSSSPNQKK